MPARRTRKPAPTPWRETPTGIAAYQTALAEAQRRANELGMDHTLEPNDLFKTWSVRLLPAKQYRFGADHTCAVIHPINLGRTQPGHGPMATRPPSTVGPDYHGGPFDLERALAEARAWEAKHGPLYPTPTPEQRAAEAEYVAKLGRARYGHPDPVPAEEK